jgi:hypothetical protein
MARALSTSDDGSDRRLHEPPAKCISRICTAGIIRWGWDRAIDGNIAASSLRSLQLRTARTCGPGEYAIYAVDSDGRPVIQPWYKAVPGVFANYDEAISESAGKQLNLATHSSLISARLDLRKAITLTPSYPHLNNIVFSWRSWHWPNRQIKRTYRMASACPRKSNDGKIDLRSWPRRSARLPHGLKSATSASRQSTMRRWHVVAPR